MNRLITALLAISVTGCGTFQNGPAQRIHVASEPAGATVTAEACGVIGEKQQQTPALFLVSRRAKKCTLRIAMDDYFPAYITLRRERSPKSAENLIALKEICGPYAADCNSLSDLAVFGALGATIAGVGYGVDYATGGMYEQTPSRVNVQLKPRIDVDESETESETDESSRR